MKGNRRSFSSQPFLTMSCFVAFTKQAIAACLLCLATATEVSPSENESDRSQLVLKVPFVSRNPQIILNFPTFPISVLRSGSVVKTINCKKKFNGDYYGLVHIRMYRVCACFSRRLAKIHNSSDGCLRSLFCAWLTEPLFEVFLQHRQVSHLAGFALRPTTSSLKRGEGRRIPEVLHDHKLVSSEF